MGGCNILSIQTLVIKCKSIVKQNGASVSAEQLLSRLEIDSKVLAQYLLSKSGLIKCSELMPLVNLMSGEEHRRHRSEVSTG